MSLRSTLIVGLVALGACAGCTTSTVGSSANGMAAPAAVERDIPSCSGGTYYNRAAALCVGPGGP